MQKPLSVFLLSFLLLLSLRLLSSTAFCYMPQSELESRELCVCVCVYHAVVPITEALVHTITHLPVATHHGEMHQLIFFRQGGVFKTF